MGSVTSVSFRRPRWRPKSAIDGSSTTLSTNASNTSGLRRDGRRSGGMPENVGTRSPIEYLPPPFQRARSREGSASRHGPAGGGWGAGDGACDRRRRRGPCRGGEEAWGGPQRGWGGRGRPPEPPPPDVRG